MPLERGYRGASLCRPLCALVVGDALPHRIARTWPDGLPVYATTPSSCIRVYRRGVLFRVQSPSPQLGPQPARSVQYQLSFLPGLDRDTAG